MPHILAQIFGKLFVWNVFVGCSIFGNAPVHKARSINTCTVWVSNEAFVGTEHTNMYDISNVHQQQLVIFSPTACVPLMKSKKGEEVVNTCPGVCKPGLL